MEAVATNEAWYHRRGRARLHDALTVIRHSQALSEVQRLLKTNHQYWLKSRENMRALFRSTPEALRNSLAIAERCSDFNLSDYMADRYRFPDCPVPDGHDAQSWFEELCRQAARRRYDRIDRRVRDRLDEEFALIRHHGLAGFFLIYHRVVQLAREVMLELGHGDSEMPLEWQPPGRGRGSSVVMLTGYLIGLSHVDPLAYDLSLDRFLPEDLSSTPDIDLDFPARYSGGADPASHRGMGVGSCRADRHGRHLPVAGRHTRPGQGAGLAGGGDRAAGAAGGEPVGVESGR